MSLQPGARFGAYEIAARLGAGGMGEVWRAHDGRLGREVALKLVADAFVADAERTARFEREAKLLAACNHPNIAVLYGQEECDGRRALVLELVEGLTLADRLEQQGALAPREALELARQVAEALAHAHAHGILHRDLKPANLKLTAEGLVKVLDFGLGRPIAGEAGAELLSSPTLTRPGTAAGVVLGTAPYMSPEQARGQAVDRRSDIWSFGVILFEMLTGTRPFQGGTTSDVLAAILQGEIDWSRLPQATPPAARRLLRRCLERDARERLRDFEDARLELTEAIAELDAPAAPSGAPRRWLAAALPWAVAAAAVAAAVPVALSTRRAPQTPRVSRLILRLSPRPLTMAGFALSLDGSQLAYVSSGQLRLRALDDESVRALPDARGRSPFFSPDGAWIGFVDADELPSKIKASGGPVQRLADPPLRVGQCVWAPDDAVLCTQPGSSRPGELLRIPAAGGPPQRLPTTAAGAREVVLWPALLPGGRSVLLTVPNPAGGPVDDATIVAQSLDTGERRELVREGAQAVYAATGHLVFGRGSALLAAPFDPSSLSVHSAPLPVAEHVTRDTVRGGRFALSADGTLVYSRETADERRLLWVDRQGRTEHVALPVHTFIDPRVSPDGGRLAVQAADGDIDVWICDIARGSLRRVSFDPGEDETPVWSPDGAWLAWATQRSGRPRQLVRRRADGSGEERLVWSTARHAHLHDWSPDGKQLLATQEGGTGSRDVWLVPVDGGEARSLLAGPFEECNPRFSPDGRWLAYSSDESGRFEVYVVRLPRLDRKAQVSVGGGDRPVWSARGREVVYRGADGRVASVRFASDARGEPSVSRPAPLFADSYGAATGRTSHVDYDVDPDGSRFVMVGAGAGPALDMNVVLGWFEELKRVGSAGR